MVAPIIETDAMWVGTVVGMKRIFMGSWIEAVHRAVAMLLRALPGSFDVGNVKHAPLVVDVSVRSEDKIVGGMVGVGGINTLHDADSDVRYVVAIGVLEEQNVWRLCHVAASICELDPRWKIKPVGENSRLIGDSIIIRIFKDNNLFPRIILETIGVKSHYFDKDLDVITRNYLQQ